MDGVLTAYGILPRRCVYSHKVQTFYLLPSVLTRRQDLRLYCTIANFGRDNWIRTSDLTHPKGALYQAEPYPDKLCRVRCCLLST